MRFAPGDMRCALQIIHSVAGPIRAKRGCRAWKVELDTADPGLVQYREEWDEEDFARHVRSEEFRRILFAIDLCAEEPRVTVGDLVGQEGLAYLLSLREGVRPHT